MLDCKHFLLRFYDFYNTVRPFMSKSSFFFKLSSIYGGYEDSLYKYFLAIESWWILRSSSYIWCCRQWGL